MTLKIAAPTRTDPLQVVWDALELHDCQPRGSAHKFTARCPAHDDHSPSLSVSEGSDGRVLLWCWAGCTTRQVVQSLGLGFASLFPDGHRHGRALPVLAKPKPPIDLVLGALLELGIGYHATRNPDMWVAPKCPACNATTNFPLWVGTHSNRVTLACFNGCEQHRILAALEDNA